MEKANCIVNLGGDAGNQVHKYDVTPAEVAVLQAIHGEDAIHSIAVNGETGATQRQERERLEFIYGHSRGPGNAEPVLKELFPGRGARLPETFDELEMPDTLFAEPQDADEDEAPKAKKAAKKGGKKAAAKPAHEPEQDDDNGGVEDMDDNVLG